MFCWLDDLLHASHLYGHTQLCMQWWFSRQLCWLNAFTIILSPTTMYGLMCYRISLFTDCLITHLAGLTAFTTMHALMHYTRHMNKDVHCYVCVDVDSDCCVDWMPNYAHHMNTDAPQYVCVDVLSDYSSHWISSYTLRKYMATHPYVYHTNICIQYFVHEVFHSQYPGKNTKIKHQDIFW